MPDHNLEVATQPKSIDLDLEVTVLLAKLIAIDLPRACLENLHKAVSDAFTLSLGMKMTRVMGDDADKLIAAIESGDEVTVERVFSAYFPSAIVLVRSAWEEFVSEFILDTRILECLFTD